MQKKVGLCFGAIAAAVLLTAISSYLSPYWTIYQMKQAYDRRDATAFSAHIDFPSLRASVKAQMQASLREKLATRLSGNFLANLGAALAANVAEPVVDALVSPESVSQAFSNAAAEDAAQPPTTPAQSSPLDPASASSANGATPTKSPAPQADRQAHYLIRYRGWSTVAASALGGISQTRLSRNPLWSPDNTFVFVRDGLWSWHLAAIEFPPGTLK